LRIGVTIRSHILFLHASTGKTTTTTAAAAAVSPLRVVYTGYDFRKHAMGSLTEGLLCSHTNNNSSIYVIVASYGPYDGSVIRQHVQSCVNTFVDISAVDDSTAAYTIYNQSAHILVDLMGFTTSCRSRISALKPTPIVIQYLGYPGSTGGVYTDYAIVDKHVLPPEKVSTCSCLLVYTSNV
jgi:protein O-GlcNAc transferase